MCFWKLQTIVIGAIDSGPMVRLNIAAGACGKGSSPQVKQEEEIREIEKGRGKTKSPKAPPPVDYFVQLSRTPEITHRAISQAPCLEF